MSNPDRDERTTGAAASGPVRRAQDERRGDRERRDDHRDDRADRDDDDDRQEPGRGKPQGEQIKPAEEDQPQSPEDRHRARRKKWIIGGIIAALVLIGLAVGIPWYLHARHFESTDDAFVDAHSGRVAPQVAGRVRRVLVDDNQQVAAGQPLVEIDQADFTVTVDQAQAAVAEAQAKLAQAQAQEQVARANVDQAAADVEQAQVNQQNAATELQRYEGLSPEAQSRQRLDDLRAAARNAAAQLTAMQKKLAATRAQVDLAASQVQAGKASIQSAQSQLESAKLQLSYTTLVAALPGRVTQRQVQAGDYVRVGQQLMILVPEQVWITANYKETQLTDMRVGQPVTVEVDAFPDVEFHGKVQSIQRGSGAWFSLLPPENATGNYVKVVQRVPVKIVLDDVDSDAYRRLAPGISVTPKVRVR